jgi:uncharacterized repeat protein (TIGR04076 family)
MKDTFELYDLKVTTVKGEKPFVCSHVMGEYFLVQGENLVFPKKMNFSLYSLAGLLPILPAKQRITDSADWITTDAIIACTDPNCGGQFRIDRVKRRMFRHGDVTVVPPGKGENER